MLNLYKLIVNYSQKSKVGSQDCKFLMNAKVLRYGSVPRVRAVISLVSYALTLSHKNVDLSKLKVHQPA